MRADRRRAQAGYTLVELIIATAIGAIVMGALTSVILTTVLATNVATSRVDASNQVRSFQLTAYDDMALSTIPAPPTGCGVQASPCTTQDMVLQGRRMANQGGLVQSYRVTYAWDATNHVVRRNVAGGPGRTVATNVSSYAWYVDSSGAHPTIVVSLTVTFDRYAASQSMRFYPRVTGP